MVDQLNPWTARFEPLPSVEEIRRRATIEGKPVGDLASLPLEDACQKLKSALERVYHPTDAICQLLLHLLAVAIAHCREAYTDRRAFRDAVYGEIPQLLRPAICLTGLAGVGKSQFLKALRRLMPVDSEVVVDSDHSPFPLIALWYLMVNVRTHLSKILMAFFPKNTDQSTLGSLTSVREVLPRRAFECGVSLIALDELQFVSLSQRANARVADILLTLWGVGTPFVFAANFSLGHRLKKRPHEERQRLLSSPLILTPERVDSADWVGLLRALRAVAPPLFNLELAKDAVAIHRYTAGLPRLVVELLLAAYRHARELGQTTVQMSDVQAAYLSIEYSQNRADVEALRKIEFSDGRDHLDLRCPFELSPKRRQTPPPYEAGHQDGAEPSENGKENSQSEQPMETAASPIRARGKLSPEELLDNLHRYRKMIGEE